MAPQLIGSAITPITMNSAAAAPYPYSGSAPSSYGNISGSLPATTPNASQILAMQQGFGSGSQLGALSGDVSLAGTSYGALNHLTNGATANPNVSAGLGALGGGLQFLQGINQGGVVGYGNAAVGGLRAASSVASMAGDTSLAGTLGSAAGYIAAPLAVYSAIKNWQSGATGSDALSGAEAGAAVGSIVLPGFGTIIGGLIGGAVGAVSSAFGGGRPDQETTNTYAANSAGANSLANQSPATSFQYLAGVMDAKNNTPGHSTALEQTFGRMGESSVVNGMAAQIDAGVKSGAITRNSTPTQVCKNVIRPWLHSKGVSSSSLTFTDAHGGSSGSNLQDALTNLAGSYMSGQLNPDTQIGVSGQQDTSLPSFIGFGT